MNALRTFYSFSFFLFLLEAGEKIKWKISTFVLNQDSLTFTHKISYFVITLIHNSYITIKQKGQISAGSECNKIVLKKTMLGKNVCRVLRYDCWLSVKRHIISKLFSFFLHNYLQKIVFDQGINFECILIFWEISDKNRGVSRQNSVVLVMKERYV